jgi:hypothetical protein
MNGVELVAAALGAAYGAARAFHWWRRRPASIPIEGRDRYYIVHHVVPGQRYDVTLDGTKYCYIAGRWDTPRSVIRKLRGLIRRKAASDAKRGGGR